MMVHSGDSNANLWHQRYGLQVYNGIIIISQKSDNHQTRFGNPSLQIVDGIKILSEEPSIGNTETKNMVVNSSIGTSDDNAY